MSAKRRWQCLNSLPSSRGHWENEPRLCSVADPRPLLHLLLIIGVVLSFFVPFAPAAWLHAIDWHTIITLSGLMLLTKGIELSGYFDVIGRKMARRFVTERQLAILWCWRPRCFPPS